MKSEALMLRITALVCLLVTSGFAAPKTAPKPTVIPTPASVFGFEPGADYHLADYEQMTSYFQKLAAAAPQRVKLETIGKSGYGRDMFVAIISSEENMKQLDHYKQIVQQLASGTIDEPTARKLSNEGKVIVWIDGGLHSTEVAGAQQSPLIGYRLASEETPEMQRIRNDVITVLCPVINPDGLDIVAHWYEKNYNTPFETAPVIELWNRYVGHDNNRDWYSFNQVESRNVARLLYYEWLPQIVYNQHQTAPYPARIIVPPYDDPTNPNIPPEVLRGVNLVGSAMAERFDDEHKSGVVSHMSFDTWWNGGMRTAPYYHNMIGILTETAGFLAGYASPGYAAPNSLPKAFPNGVSAVTPSTFYPNPWKGGWWRLRDSVDYMVTGDMGILDIASRRRDEWLYGFWKMSRDQIALGQKGGPYAYIVPEQQHDPAAAGDMLFSLQTGGVKISEATAPFTADGKQFPAGTRILSTAQPFRPFIMDLMEAQKYPDLRVSPGGPPKRPYDMTGWTLPMQMGVEVVRLDQPASLSTKPIEVTEPEHTFKPASGQIGRVGLYISYVPNMDAGWTQWLLDRYHIPYKPVHDADLRKGDLKSNYDVIVMPDQSPDGILHGWQEGEPARGEFSEFAGPSFPSVQRQEFAGGIGLEGALALKNFAEAGGHIVAFDHASSFLIEELGLPVHNVLAGVSSTQFYAPGSLLRINVDPNLSETHGMEPNSVAFFVNSEAFQVWDPKPPSQPYRYEQREKPAPNAFDQLGDHDGIHILAKYAKEKTLLSGWLLGEQHVADKIAAVSVPYGKGRVVLIGFRCQFRGQSENTFPLLFNSLVVGNEAGTPAGQ